MYLMEKYDFNKRKIKSKLTWNELISELELAHKDTNFRKALRAFIKATTS